MEVTPRRRHTSVTAESVVIVLRLVVQRLLGLQCSMQLRTLWAPGLVRSPTPRIVLGRRVVVRAMEHARTPPFKMVATILTDCATRSLESTELGPPTPQVASPVFRRTKCVAFAQGHGRLHTMTPPPQSNACPGEQMENPQAWLLPQSSKHEEPSVHEMPVHFMPSAQLIVHEEPLQDALSVEACWASISQVALSEHVTSHLLGWPSHAIGQKLLPAQESWQLPPSPPSSTHERWHEQSVGQDAEQFCPMHPPDTPAQHSPKPHPSQGKAHPSPLQSASAASVLPSQSLSRASLQLSGWSSPSTSNGLTFGFVSSQSPLIVAVTVSVPTHRH